MRRFVAVGVLALAAHASVESYVEALTTFIEKRGPLAKPLESFDQFADRIADDPEQARKLCESAARYVYRRAPRDRGNWEVLTEKLVPMAKQTLARAEDDADAHVAAAEALVCKVRLADAFDRQGDTKEWLEAAELLVKAHAIDADGGKPLERAARVLRNGAKAVGTDPGALLKRAGEVCAAGAKQHPANEFFMNFELQARLTRAESALAKDRKEGKRLLERLLGDLQVRANGLKPPRPVLTAYNDVVTMIRAAKRLGLKADYLTEKGASSRGWLEFELPRSSRWRFDRGKAQLGRIYQYDREEKLMRTISFYYFNWNTNYYDGPKEFGGDNLKGLAALGERQDKEEILQVKRHRRPRRTKLNRHLRACVAYEVGGIDEDDDYVTYSSYYFKNKKQGRSLRIAILEYRKLKLDPEARAVLDSIRLAG